MKTNDPKRKKRVVDGADNPIEAIKNIASSVVDETSSIPSDLTENAFRQLFGSPQSVSGDLSPNQELNLNQTGETEGKTEILAYQKQRETIEKDVFSYKETVEVKKQLDELLRELKILAQKTQELSQEVKIAAMEEMPVNPGTYHINFFEWLIRMIKSLREKVEDSQTWLRVFASKKKQRGYWSMFKKHGTSFTLSSERVMATQTG